MPLISCVWLQWRLCESILNTIWWIYAIFTYSFLTSLGSLCFGNFIFNEYCFFELFSRTSENLHSFNYMEFGVQIISCPPNTSWRPYLLQFVVFFRIHMSFHGDASLCSIFDTSPLQFPAVFDVSNTRGNHSPYIQNKYFVFSMIKRVEIFQNPTSRRKHSSDRHHSLQRA